MRPLLLAAVSLALIGGPCLASAPKPSKSQIAAVADAGRPEADRKRDEDRKPLDMLAFVGVKPGMKVADLIPGGGYFTRIFSAAVGPKGTVYAYLPAEFARFAKAPLPKSGEHSDPARPNVIFITTPANELALPETVDVAWTSQNYHDLKEDFAKPAETAKFNAAVFRALKPGGVYVILDHSAEAGSGERDLGLHRIDEAVVRREVEAAGFVFMGSSDALRNPSDDRKLNVFDKAIRAHTDQFILKFRKPK